MNFKGNVEERMNANSFINGYLYNEIPNALTEYLHRVLGEKPKSDDVLNNYDRENDSNEIYSLRRGELSSIDKHGSNHGNKKQQYGTNKLNNEVGGSKNGQTDKMEKINKDKVFIGKKIDKTDKVTKKNPIMASVK